MKIPKVVANGLKEIYGPTGRQVYAYSNNKGSIRYLALRPEVDAPSTMPGFDDHQLLGVVDFESMTVVGQERPPPNGEVAQGPGFSVLGLALNVAKWFLIFLVAACFVVIGVFAALAGGSRSR